MEKNKIHCMDCLLGMKQMSDKSVDLILTDPPYNIGYCSGGGSSGYIERMHQFEWDDDFDFVPFFNEMMRVLKDNAMMIVFSRFDVLFQYAKQGLPNPVSVLIWDKKDYGMGDLDWFSLSYEIAIVWVKGNKPQLNKLNGKRPQGMLRYVKVQNFQNPEIKPSGNDRQAFMLHPTQKPTPLIRDLVAVCSKEKDVVFDPFMGSGTTAVACQQLNRDFIGFEISQEYCDIANKRLQQEPLRNFFETGQVNEK